MPTPYADHLAGEDPVKVLKSSLAHYRAMAPLLTPALWAHARAPGKWTLQQTVLHVAQWEMIFGVRVRCALGVADFVVQPLDQDHLMVAEELAVDGPTALAAFDAVRCMNLALASSLSAAQRQTTCRHPERGVITVEDLLVTLAGHAVHHFKQIRDSFLIPDNS
jgi:DinB superfamily